MKKSLEYLVPLVSENLNVESVTSSLELRGARARAPQANDFPCHGDFGVVMKHSL